MMDDSPAIDDIKGSKRLDKILIKDRSFLDIPPISFRKILLSEIACALETRVIDINTYYFLRSEETETKRHKPTPTSEVYDRLTAYSIFSSEKFTQILPSSVDFILIKFLQKISPIFSKAKIISIHIFIESFCRILHSIYFNESTVSSIQEV